MKASRWDINVVHEAHQALVPRLEAFVTRLFECLDLKHKELSILLTDDQQIHQLNREYRGVDRPTDVLSFPQEESASQDGYAHLGDIVISMDRAERQAKHLDHALVTEVSFLVLHGLLHLLGYDHESDEGQMLALQKDLKSKLGAFLSDDDCGEPPECGLST